MFVDISRITKTFRQDRAAARRQQAPLKVLEEIDLQIEQGEFVSLLGASGCGKTTLLRIVSGLVRADSGTVKVGDRIVTEPRQDLCMVFQAASLLPWRNVLDNVTFPLEVDGKPKRERHAAGRRLLELVGLSDFEHHFPHELSGGMQQRVGIARALIRDPSVLLMDEPFGALDAQTREVLQEDLLRIWAKTRCTVLFVTHSIDEALMLSDRVVVLDRAPGRINTIVTPPFKGLRAQSDVRMHPEFAPTRAALRQRLT